MHETVIIALASIIVLTFLCQWLAWWVKLPSILFLLLTGILIGPGLDWLDPSKLFGDILTPMIEIAVAIILFEGSMTLNFKQIKGHMDVVGSLLTNGVIITVIGATLMVHFLFHLSIELSILLGVIVCVSGPTVIAPLLRTVRPNERVSNILRWEGIVIDPIGALLAVLVFSFIQAYHAKQAFDHVILMFLLHVGIGAAIGALVGYFCGLALRRHWFPEYLHNVATLALVILAYTIANHFNSGSGLLAVTVMGIWLANMKDVHIEDILDFKESLSIILISGLFIVLAAQISFTHLHDIIWPAIILIAGLQFVLRPLTVFICTLSSKLNWREKFLLAWIFPRGIVAAAVSALFAIRLKQNNIAGSHQLVLITFLVIIGTVVFQSLTTRWVAKLLKVSEPEPRGYLIVGANPVARVIAAELVKRDYRVLLTSAVWEHVQASRMDGLPTFYGNPVSSYADRHLDLIGLGGMIAISARTNLNTLASMRYKREFGAQNIFSVQTERGEQDDDHKQTAAGRFKGHMVFKDGMTFAKLNQLIRQNDKLTSTTLSEEYDFEKFRDDQPKNVLLFAFDPKNRVHFFSAHQEIKPIKEWTVISITAE